MYIKNYLIGISLLMLVGCASPYLQPEGPDTASLTFHNTASSSINVIGYKVAEDCSGGKLVFNKKPKLETDGKMKIKIKANQAFSFFYGYSVSTYNESKYCNMISTFSPKRGGKFISRFAVTGDKCYVSIVKYTASGEIKEPSFRLRKQRTPILESGSFCN